jgi:hypothetical protein
MPVAVFFWVWQAQSDLGPPVYVRVVARSQASRYVIQPQGTRPGG